MWAQGGLWGGAREETFSVRGKMPWPKGEMYSPLYAVLPPPSHACGGEIACSAWHAMLLLLTVRLPLLLLTARLSLPCYSYVVVLCLCSTTIYHPTPSTTQNSCDHSCRCPATVASEAVCVNDPLKALFC